ncbi:MAG: two-component system response regulator BaeR [Cellvibrionaceae bacterium]|jgi:two-component system response regulator BaeR
MPTKILIVEDEVKVAGLLEDYLQQSSMETYIVSDGAEVLSEIERVHPDLILLDIMLPNKDGISLCREIRQTNAMQTIPIIMTTAKVDELDRLLGLEIGADDYICKPYSPREVVARVKAVLRRYLQPRSTDQVLFAVGLDLNHEKMQARLDGHKLPLTTVEYALLRIMAESPGRIYSRSQLMDGIYTDHRVVSERTIDSHIKKLRQKMSTIESATALIHSVYGAGYKFEEEISL